MVRLKKDLILPESFRQINYLMNNLYVLPEFYLNFKRKV